MHDRIFLAVKSDVATKGDLQIAQALKLKPGNFYAVPQSVTNTTQKSTHKGYFFVAKEQYNGA